MSHRKKITSIAFTGAAATAATMIGAGPAFAAVSWHVKNGGTGYTGPFRAKPKAGTSPSLKDTTIGAVLKCKKAVASGSITTSHTPANPAVLGFVKKSVTKWSSCTTASGLVHFKGHLTTSPNLVVSAYNATTGVTSGKLSRSKNHPTSGKISGVISGTSGNTCHVKFSGTSIPLKYSNTPHSFNVNSAKKVTLHVKSVTGNCGGRLNSSDHFYVTGILHVSIPTALTISRF